jgi:hypothetical protein
MFRGLKFGIVFSLLARIPADAATIYIYVTEQGGAGNHSHQRKSLQQCDLIPLSQISLFLPALPQQNSTGYLFLPEDEL